MPVPPLVLPRPLLPLAPEPPEGVLTWTPVELPEPPRETFTSVDSRVVPRRSTEVSSLVVLRRALGTTLLSSTVVARDPRGLRLETLRALRVRRTVRRTSVG